MQHERHACGPIRLARQIRPHSTRGVSVERPSSVQSANRLMTLPSLSVTTHCPPGSGVKSSGGRSLVAEAINSTPESHTRYGVSAGRASNRLLRRSGDSIPMTSASSSPIVGAHDDLNGATRARLVNVGDLDAPGHLPRGRPRPQRHQESVPCGHVLHVLSISSRTEPHVLLPRAGARRTSRASADPRPHRGR